MAQGNKRIQYIQTVVEGSIQHYYKIPLTIYNQILSKSSFKNITYVKKNQTYFNFENNS